MEPKWLDVGFDNRRQKYIYHYTSAENFLTKILPTGKIRLSPFSNTNDPYEFHDWNFGGESNAGSQINDNLYYQINDGLRDLKKLCSFISFSTDSKRAYDTEIEGRGFADPQMWAHYSNRHSGVCLVFEKTNLVAGIKRSLKKQAQYFAARKVVYKSISKPSAMNYIVDLDEASPLGSDLYSHKYFRNNLNDLVFKKHNAWKHEREFRILVVGKTENTFFENINSSLVGIILVCKFAFRQSVDFEKMKETLTPNIFEMHWRNDSQMLFPVNPNIIRS